MCRTVRSSDADADADADGPAPSLPLAVVVIHHDAAECCVATVAALRAQGLAVAVTVVDNASSADAMAMLRDGCSDVEIIECTANLGYGPGANVGLRRWLAQGEGEWVAVAAHDALPAPGCLAALVAAARTHPDAAFVAAEFGDGFDMVPAFDWVIGGYSRPATRGRGWVDVDYPNGTLFVARRQALVDIGLFDERYFAYCEEVDLGLRARARGWRVGMVWGAVVVNGRLPSQLLADYLQVRNTLLLIRTHHGRRPAAFRSLLSIPPMFGRARRDRHRWHVHLCLEGRALIDFWRGRFGPPPPAVVATVHNAAHRASMIRCVRTALR
ncbi:MAG: glycosyltransferase [Actinomycetota bacterium]|nr:glycosyltransferase [Actinomycetota bacterium]